MVYIGNCSDITATDGAKLQFQFSTDGGSSFLSATQTTRG